ncbi:MAG: LD-carboxypeptidase [Myxococcales bacterium]|nr:LD-carboxypeptidase [Myxococcales bacterium]USN51808.1 MAG: LD-carboxypeptidase [Myxococcales bacterium]
MSPLKIALVSPSGTFESETLEQSIKTARKLDIEIISESAHRIGTPLFLNGSKHERLEELYEADKLDVDALWCTRGGCGAIEFLHDYQEIPRHGPPLIGYSDATIIHFLRNYHSKRIGIHGPIFFDLSDAKRANLEQIKYLLNKKAEELSYSPLKSLTPCLFDHIQGELIVMNLISLQSLMGAINPQFFQRKILCLEEINEPHYKVFRALQQLKNAGCFYGLKALVIGHFNQDRAQIIEQSFIPLAKELGLALFDWPIFGHEKPNWPLLFGALSTISRVNERIFTLKYSEQHDHTQIST